MSSAAAVTASTLAQSSQKDELKGEAPCRFIVLKAGVNRPPSEIEKEIVALVREKIGPVAAFKIAKPADDGERSSPMYLPKLDSQDRISPHTIRC